MKEHGSHGHIFFGLVLIAVGALFLLDQMGRLDFGHFVGRFWPVVFILLGLSILIGDSFRNIVPGLFFILFGTVFLLIRLDVIDHSFWHYVWPLAIVAAGIWILIRPARPCGCGDGASAVGTSVSTDAGDELNIKLLFSGTSRKAESRNFKGGVIEVVFGSAEIDLRGARLAGGEAAMVMSSIFGSIEVMVPHEWQVVLEGSPILGEIETHKRAVPDAEKTGTLRIKASAVFGSVEIKE